LAAEQQDSAEAGEVSGRGGVEVAAVQGERSLIAGVEHSGERRIAVGDAFGQFEAGAFMFRDRLIA
jgi:hypothetical protein